MAQPSNGRERRKAIIENLETGAVLTVMFNPTEFVVAKSTQWAEHPKKGHDLPDVEFGGGQRKVLSFELFFDTTEKSDDVRVHTRKIEDLTLIHRATKAPPRLMFKWGTFELRCVMDAVESRYVRFLSDGTPTRAQLKVTLKEYKKAKNRRSRAGRNAGLVSPGGAGGAGDAAAPAMQVVVKPGDTLSGIAGRIYGDCNRWREIWDANPGLPEPRLLQPGTTLRIPER